MKTFSIVTPIYAWNQEKADQLVRCIESVHQQTYPKDMIEHVIVNDGSIVALQIPDYPWIKVITQTNKQRITAYNNGIKEAKNEVIWMLDADDELLPDALDVIDIAYQLNPKYQMFNFGCSYVHKDGNITTRDAFEPKVKGRGHEVFGGGNIVNGTFVFTKKIFDKLGAFPEHEIHGIDCTDINYPAGGEMVRDLIMASPYDFSAWFQMEFPETRQFFMVNVDSEPDKVIKEVGNPFGNDYALFYKFTRKYRSKPLRERLERVWIR